MRELKASIRPFRRSSMASIRRDKRPNSARLVPTTATMPILSRRAACLQVLRVVGPRESPADRAEILPGSVLGINGTLEVEKPQPGR